MENGMAGKPRRIQSIIFGAILLILFILVCRLFAPFLTVILWSILFYVLLKPLYQKCTAGCNITTIKGKIIRNALAAVFSFGTVILIIIPLSFVVFQLFLQVTELIRQVRDYLALRPFSVDSFLEDVSRIVRELSSEQIIINADELRSRILGFLGMGMQRLFVFSGDAARNVGSFLISLIFMIFSLFFLFVDGAYLSKLTLRIIPIRKEYIKALVGKFKEITLQLVLGYIIVALAEVVTAFIIFSLFRIHGALVFSVLIFFFSFFPIIGPAIVWFPLGLMQILNGNFGRGILLMIVSSAFISSIENFIRPIILRGRIQLHPLIIFFAILGGISTFGFNGIILGPMIVIIFLTVFDLFLTEHKLEQK
ncbi:MAG: AI-2E family transporter [Spirochaetaceae bacterium]|nr:AI-2E family transporter [Spirochaetaceae bacterium]